MEKTLAIIKPDAFSGRHAGEIISMIEKAGFTIRAARVLLTRNAMAKFEELLK